MSSPPLILPERAEWEEIVGLYQLPKAEPLLLEVAEQLNEAYAHQQPLEKLLDHHTALLALGFGRAQLCNA